MLDCQSFPKVPPHLSQPYVPASPQVRYKDWMPLLGLSSVLVSPQWPLWVTIQAEPTSRYPDCRRADCAAWGLALDGQPTDLHVP